MINAIRVSRYAGDLVFARTEAGEGILSTTNPTLPAALLRMLGALDGRRSVDLIARDFRAGETLRSLHLLSAMGLARPLNNNDADTSNLRVDEPTRPALSTKQLQSAKAAAASAVRELLGATARPLLLELEQSRDSAALRRAVEAVKARLDRVLGPDASHIFIEAVRRAAALA